VTQDKTKPRRSGFRRFMLFGGLPLLAAGLLLVPRALAFGPFNGCHGHQARSAEDVKAHMERRADFILDKLDASDEQREQVEIIVAKAAPEFFKLKQAGRQLRRQLQQSLVAPTLDKAQIDKARAELDVLADRATDLGMDTLVAIAEVLTPAQRKQVAAHLSRFAH
jgi:Spy/CpxP family protein refolding chaperone